ncbi:MAG: hypothetical protein SFZ23_00905 [Planctomycetota bacterium]|nr:hypothetical protein [Planctomycetota bacterium]
MLSRMPETGHRGSPRREGAIPLRLSCSLTTLLALAACQAPVPQREGVGLALSEDSAATEAVLWAQVLPAPGHSTYETYATRLDARFAATSEPALPLGYWPEPSRPSLDRPVRVYLDRRAESFVYFRERRDRREQWNW